jgi:hypothetical protein
MFHRIQFRLKALAELERPGHLPLEQLLIKAGTQTRALIKPHVRETKQGPVEFADLHFEDGTIARDVRFASFTFVDG